MIYSQVLHTKVKPEGPQPNSSNTVYGPFLEITWLPLTSYRCPWRNASNVSVWLLVALLLLLLITFIMSLHVKHKLSKAKGRLHSNAIVWGRIEGYLVEAQVVLDGVGRVEDGPVGTEDQDEAVESLERERWQTQQQYRGCFYKVSDCHQVKFSSNEGYLPIAQSEQSSVWTACKLCIIMLWGNGASDPGAAPHIYSVQYIEDSLEWRRSRLNRHLNINSLQYINAVGGSQSQLGGLFLRYIYIYLYNGWLKSSDLIGS